jgi:hypothetical protein
MNLSKLFVLALGSVALLGTATTAQPPPPLNALVWGTDGTGKSAPFIVTGFIPGSKYISAFGKLDTTIVKSPQSLGWSEDVLFMSVVKYDATGKLDPATEVVFKGSRTNNDWSFNTVTSKWDPKTGTTGVYNGFPSGNYKITVQAKVKIITMQAPPALPTEEKRDAVLYTESFTVP